MSNITPELFRDRGIHVTSQRLAVMRAVAAHPHISADAVMEAVREDIGSISRQSVYDALNLLVDEGLVQRIQPEGSPALFEDRVHDNHHHLICRGCSTVVDIDCVVGAAPCLNAADSAGFAIDEAQVTFWGTCTSCTSTSTSTTSTA